MEQISSKKPKIKMRTLMIDFLEINSSYTKLDQQTCNLMICVLLTLTISNGKKYKK